MGTTLDKIITGATLVAALGLGVSNALGSLVPSMALDEINNGYSIDTTQQIGDNHFFLRTNLPFDIFHPLFLFELNTGEDYYDLSFDVNPDGIQIDYSRANPTNGFVNNNFFLYFDPIDSPLSASFSPAYSFKHCDEDDDLFLCTYKKEGGFFGEKRRSIELLRDEGEYIWLVAGAYENDGTIERLRFPVEGSDKQIDIRLTPDGTYVSRECNFFEYASFPICEELGTSQRIMTMEDLPSLDGFI